MTPEIRVLSIQALQNRIIEGLNPPQPNRGEKNPKIHGSVRWEYH